MSISRVAIVGAGFMGSGIAESAASAGIHVTVFEPDEAALERSRSRLQVSVDRALSRGKLNAKEADGLIARIAYTNEIGDLDGVDAVLEAVTEDPRVKGKLFAELDQRLPRALSGLEHLLDPDRRARRLDAAARASHRTALLLPPCRS